jgi:hypothetical protein
MTVEKSQIQVDSIESYDPTRPVIVSYGATVPSGQTFTAEGNVNIVGVVTASNFVGDGSGLTQLSIATQGRAIAFTLIT